MEESKELPPIPDGYSLVGSPISSLRDERASLLDLGMLSLNFALERGHAYSAARFNMDHKTIEYLGDVASYVASRDRILVRRQLRGPADLSSCTIAVESLRSVLLNDDADGDDFIQRYFWHQGESSPEWLLELKKEIYLVGELVDAQNSEKFFWCDSRLDQEEVHVLHQQPAYR